MSADPQRYLTAADQMLRGAGALGANAVTAGWWPKACACLIRLALEMGIDAFWQGVDPAVAACRRRRTTLLLLRRRTEPDLARRAHFAWAALSRATHHHCYESAPGAVELRRLHAEVTHLLTRLTREGPRR